MRAEIWRHPRPLPPAPERDGDLCYVALAELIMLPAGTKMKSVRSLLVEAPNKAPTGIAGFDEIAGGALPRGRTTLLMGGPGAGKTILALQFLAHGAQDCRESGESGASPASDRQRK
jgi:RecA/RadA recombinase